MVGASKKFQAGESLYRCRVCRENAIVYSNMEIVSVDVIKKSVGMSNHCVKFLLAT